jgi:hypothetical protein
MTERTNAIHPQTGPSDAPCENCDRRPASALADRRCLHPAGLRLWPALLAAIFIAGCGSSKPAAPPATTAVEPVYTYYAMNSQPNASGGSLLYTIDHVKNNVVQSSATRTGVGLAGSGSFTSSANGFLAPVLNTFVSPIESGEVGNWAVELPGVAGFFYQSVPNSANLDGTTGGPLGQGDTTQNVIPLVSNSVCPSYPQAQIFQFVSFPGALHAGGDSGLGNGAGSWNPLVDTAYGSVSLSTAGPLVNLVSIAQYLLPSATTPPGIPVTVNPGPFSASGGCGSSLDGNVASITVPVVGPDGSITPIVSAIGISSGLLLQDNNGQAAGFSASNLLGGGYGALGLAQPASPVDTGSVVKAGYNGFLSYSGAVGSVFSTTVSFPASAAASCAAFQQSLQQLSLAPSANTLYGGEFAGNDPSTNAAAQCDFAVDLGVQDANHNGLYPNATLYVGNAFPLNQTATGRTGLPYGQPAVAIAGPVAGKNAIFVISADSGGLGPSFTGASYSVGLYLLQQ